MKNNLFSNSDVLFVEYIDVIKAPTIELLQICKLNPKLREIMNFSSIDLLNPIELAEWYKNRKHKNPLIELIRENIKTDGIDMDELLFMQIGCDDRFVEYGNFLPFYEVIRFLEAQKMCEKMVMYTEFECKPIEKDIKNINPNIEYVYGNFIDVVKQYSSDMTLVLSDITKVIQLQDNDMLNYKTVMVPQDYRYNKDKDNKWKINLEEEFKKQSSIFKYGFFHAYWFTN